MRNVNIRHSQCVGSVLRFTYNGGDHPGVEHTVYVKSRRGQMQLGNLQTWDFTRGACREFQPQHIANGVALCGVDGAYSVSKKVLPDNILALINQYNKEGKLVYQTETDLIIVKAPDKPTVKYINGCVVITVGDNTIELRQRNVASKTIPESDVAMRVSSKGSGNTIVKVNPQEIADVLNGILR